MSDQPAVNRRPIKTRQWAVIQALAQRLSRSGATPNGISLASVVFGLLAGGALVATSQVDDTILRRVLWFSAAVFVQLRLLANLLDGMVAVEGGKATAVGELYNEVPDRVADAFILGGAGLAVGGCPLLGLTAAIIAVFVAYVRAIGASVGVGQVFLGPFAKPQRMALMTLVCLALSVLPVSWQPIHEPTGVGIMGTALALIIVGGAFTAWRRLRRIATLMREAAEKSETE